MFGGIMKKIEQCKDVAIHKEAINQLKNDNLLEEQIDQVSKFYKIISDKTRLKILYYLKKRELCVCDICELLQMEQSAISHQLAVLKKYNFVKYSKKGKEVFYSLSDYHIDELINSAINHIKEKEKNNGND